MLAELASRGYPAMALDLRGHGESPFGPPDDFGAETLARDVWDAVVAHGVYATEGSNPRASRPTEGSAPCACLRTLR